MNRNWIMATDTTDPGVKRFNRHSRLIISTLHNRAVELNTHHSHFVVTLCGHSLCTWTLVRAMRSSCSTAACVGGPSDPWPRWRLMTSDYNRLHGSQNQLTHTLLHICRRAHTYTLWGVCVWSSEWWKGNESQGCQTCQSKWHVHTRTDY